MTAGRMRALSSVISGIACLLLIAGATFAQTTSFGSGTFLVNVDIAPGLYRSSMDASMSCYWERLSGLGGTLNDIIANGSSDGPTLVKIASSDYAFSSTGCSRWNRVEQQGSNQPAVPSKLATDAKHLPPPCVDTAKAFKPPKVAYCPDPYIRMVPVKRDEMFASAWHCRASDFTMLALRSGPGCGGSGGFVMADGNWALPGEPPPSVATFINNTPRKHVQGDKLEIKKCYTLIAEVTSMSGISMFDNIKVPKGNVICVRDKLEIQNELYYKVQIKKMGTLDRSQHTTAWVKVKRVNETGAWLSD